MTDLATLIYDHECRLFDRMQDLGYDRTGGENALIEQRESDLADRWVNWWDEGSE